MYRLSSVAQHRLRTYLLNTNLSHIRRLRRGMLGDNSPMPNYDLRPDIIHIMVDDAASLRLFVEDYTPNLHAMLADGTLVQQFQTMPLCSSTRLALLSGEYGRTTGVGRVLTAPMEAGNQPDYANLPTWMRLLPYNYAIMHSGKFHLEPDEASLRSTIETMGFLKYCAQRQNLYGRDANYPGGSPSWADQDYSNYFEYTEEDPDEQGTWIAGEYATTRQFENARKMWQNSSHPRALNIWLNAPHSVYTSPPGFPDVSEDSAKYNQMIAHIDIEIAEFVEKVLMSQGERPIYIFIYGDNGDPPEVVSGGGKGSITRTGVHVPMLCIGSDIPRGKVRMGPVSVVDMGATTLDLAYLNQTPPTLGQGQSFIPWLLSHDPDTRTNHAVYTEVWEPNGTPATGNWTRNAWRSRGSEFSVGVSKGDYMLVETLGSPDVRTFSRITAFPYTVLDVDNLTSEEQTEYDQLLGFMNTNYFPNE